MSTPTKEDLEKQAAETHKQVARFKQMGFINHCKAAGLSDEVVRTRHAAYVEQDKQRTENLEQFRKAITG